MSIFSGTIVDKMNLRKIYNLIY